MTIDHDKSSRRISRVYGLAKILLEDTHVGTQFIGPDALQNNVDISSRYFNWLFEICSTVTIFYEFYNEMSSKFALERKKHH